MILWFGPIWHGVPRLAKYPLVSGVYLISEKEKNRKIVRYVGQAQNIKDRMERHQNDESNPELKKLLTERTSTVYVYYAEVDGLTDRNNLELTAIKKYGGIDELYNKQTPLAELLVGVNFPDGLTSYLEKKNTRKTF